MISCCFGKILTEDHFEKNISADIDTESESGRRKSRRVTLTLMLRVTLTLLRVTQTLLRVTQTGSKTNGELSLQY